jgi:hypothetical protein
LVKNSKTKKSFIFIVSLLILAGTIASLVSFRHHQFITKLTDNYWVFTTINQIAKITDIPYLGYRLKTHQLPQYQVLVSELELLSLESSLPNPQQTHLIQKHDQEISATFIDDQGTPYQVKLKYRGNSAVHWAFPKKSYRIIFTNESPFKNLTSIDLIIPEDRGLIFEHLANYRAEKLGLLAPQSWFGTVSINHHNPSLYYLSEQLNQSFLDQRNLKGTLFGEKDDINNWNQNIYQNSDRWQTSSNLKKNPDYKYLDQLLSLIDDQSSTSEQVLQLLDLDNFLNWQAHSVLMSSLHQDQSHNNRLFFNHQIQKFQLIPWDTGQREMVSEDLNSFHHPITDKLLLDPDILEKRNQILRNYLDNPIQVNQDTKFFNNSLKKIYTPLLQDDSKLHPNFKYLNDIKKYRQWLNSYFKKLRLQLN